jgi:hypothetical protein
MAEKRLPVRVVALGEPKSNNVRLKTDLLLRYCKQEPLILSQGNFAQSSPISLVVDGIPVELHLVDTLGQEASEDLKKTVIPSADCFLLPFSNMEKGALDAINTKVC